MRAFGNMNIWGKQYNHQNVNSSNVQVKSYFLLQIKKRIGNSVWSWMDWPYVYKRIVFRVRVLKWQPLYSGYFYVRPIKRPKNAQQLTTHGIHLTVLHVCWTVANIFPAGLLPFAIIFYSNRNLFNFFLNVFDWFYRVSIKEASVGKLGSVCRRVYRIFSHAYFHHRRVFDEFESETFLCHRFTHFVTKYTLMSKENLIVPIDGETDVGTVVGESEA